MKYSLYLKQNMPFASCPYIAELDDINILCNDVVFPEHIEHCYNPHNTRLFVIGHEFGPICAVWAYSDKDALDNAVNENKLDCLLCEDGEDVAYLGNAGEPFDLDFAWIGEVDFDAARDIKLIMALVRSEGETL